MGIENKIEESMDWYKRAKGFFAPFKPEAKSVSLNHRTKSCEIKLSIEVPDGVRRRVAKIEIPAYPGFRVRDVVDDGFTPIPNAFYLDEDKWKLDARKLTASEKYLVRLEGTVSTKVVDMLVRIQPARNRDQTVDLDRYWLDSMIRDVEVLEKVWHFMEVEDVDVAVNVSVERCFASALPADLTSRLDATAEWLEAGQSIDRNKVFGAWLKYRSATKALGLPTKELVETAKELVAPQEFSSYISVDPPYHIASVSTSPSTGQSAIPDQVRVEATTSLSTKSTGAKGYLSFKKKLFADEVRAQMSRIF